MLTILFYVAVSGLPTEPLSSFLNVQPSEGSAKSAKKKGSKQKKSTDDKEWAPTAEEKERMERSSRKGGLLQHPFI